MNHSRSAIYRACLLALVILTIAGGIFYYVNYVKGQATVTEGTLVERPAPDDGVAIEGFRPFGSSLECA